MMGMLWVVLLVALAGSQFGQGFPLRSTPQAYPHDENAPSIFEGWGPEGGAYAAIPALALVITAVGLLLGCTWCYRHKDCKPNEGADNQLFTASATHLHDARRSQPPDSGFSEPVNNNISEDNNNGPISLREMQNIANNNAAAYIISENEERNRVSRESVVEFEPLPTGIRVADPLEHCADWFGVEDFPRNRLQYLRELARGWFGRVVEGEIEDNGVTTTVAVKILNQNASLEDKARFLDEARVYRDVQHENILAFIAKCLQQDPWIMIFEHCSMDLRQYLTVNRPKMAALNEAGVPLQLMCDVSAALAYLHSRGYHSVTGAISSDNVLVREAAERPRAVVGGYAPESAPSHLAAPETRRQPPEYTASSAVWSLGVLVWEVCAWGAPPPAQPPPPDLPCPYSSHLYQVMQLCWHPEPEYRPTAAQVHALINHLHASHTHVHSRADGHGATDFEERWQRLKPNTIPKLDEHIAIIHAPSTSMASHFTTSDHELDTAPTAQDTLSVDMDTAVSRSSSIMSDKDPLSIQFKSESMNNLHGSLEDVRNIYLTHNETALLECHQGNIGFEDCRDHSDSSVDPWLKDIIAGSQDDVSYYRDVSDVIKNLDNILNSEKTSSSESSHQASPSRDNLSLDCKKDFQIPSSMVKSPGISNFQNLLVLGFDGKDDDPCEEDDVDRETIGTLSHSFERHSDTTSQHTLENLTPDTPIKDIDVVSNIASQNEPVPQIELEDDIIVDKNEAKESLQTETPKEDKIDCSNSIPKLKELCVASMSSVSDTNKQLNVREDCETPCDSNLTEIIRTDTEVKTKSIDNTAMQNPEEYINTDTAPVEQAESIVVETSHLLKMDDLENNLSIVYLDCVEEKILPNLINENTTNEIESDFAPIILNIVPESEDTEIKPDESLEEDVLSPKSIDTSSDEAGDSTVPIGDLVTPAENITDSSKSLTMDVIKDNVIPHMDSSNECRHTCVAVISEDLKCANEESYKMSNILESIEDGLESKLSMQAPEAVQLIMSTEKPIETAGHTETENAENYIQHAESIAPILPPEEVQNKRVNEQLSLTENIAQLEDINKEDIIALRSDTNCVIEHDTNDSTVYLDLINDTNSEKINIITLDNNVNDMECCIDLMGHNNDYTQLKNESTVYLDLPSMIKETGIFLHSERAVCSQSDKTKGKICSSTPNGTDSSADNTQEDSAIDKASEFSETKIPYHGPGATLAKVEQKCMPDYLSPFESPTKSHHTDTYDENSSVVLGPFENCTIEFKGKPELVEIPKEELLAFSSNFSEMNLETPSPLRDGNFLNEVPDITHEDLQFDDITISEVKPEKEPQSDNTDDTDQSGTAKRVSPSTPPNSPGIFLASTSQQKYLVDIDLDTPNETAPSFPPIESDSGLSSLQKEIDINQIELQITSKLAMAENENNLNIEYSGPLTVEGLVSEDDSMLLRESDAIPESYLAGNGGSVEERFTLDEECVKALRNELELKLPLAQVAAIEPACESESEWSELPPPPELVVSYCGAGALSPIAEETRHQLSAYENDAWNISTRTDSSESYPEPCNNSTDEVTDLPTGAPSASNHTTYTIHSDHTADGTYTIQRDIPSSKEITMSADSLNGSPYKKQTDNNAQSPIDDRTYNKNEDEKESNCERISQVSPFLMSPTTDTSAPADSANPTGVSSQSRTTATVPTDAKLSKPSELSKATSIDSWCSNDTLYNVEENFDDLVMDSDVPLDFHEKERSDSTDTLTHNDDEKELSHCSTYIVHDSKSDAYETFSPDSITANDNYTYTKARTEAAVTETKSEVNDSTKNTQTKDLAYGTLPSYSNCTTEVVSGFDDHWKLSQPELVRRSPIGDDVLTTPPKFNETDKIIDNSPQIASDPCVKKMDSVEISCLQDEVIDSQNKTESSEGQGLFVDIDDSPKYDYRNMAPSVTSTPLIELVVDSDDGLDVPEESVVSPEFIMSSIPNFTAFQQSAEIRPQGISPNESSERGSTGQYTDLLLEGESKTQSRESNRDSLAISDRTPTYSDFESSALAKPQEIHSRDVSSQSMESGMSSGDFRQFETYVRSCPQDLSAAVDASSLLLNSERKSSSLAMGLSTNTEFDHTSQSGSRVNDIDPSYSPPNVTNLVESHVDNIINVPNVYVTDFDTEEETDQPHSIIITEIMKDISLSPNINESSNCKVDSVVPIEEPKQSPDRTFDSHTGLNQVDLNHTYDSHTNRQNASSNIIDNSDENPPKVNGINDTDHVTVPTEDIAPKIISVSNGMITDPHKKEIPNGSLSQDSTKGEDIKCNGNSENYAIVNFLKESFEELLESNVDGNDKDAKNDKTDALHQENHKINSEIESPVQNIISEEIHNDAHRDEGKVNGTLEVGKMSSVTENFLQNEKKFCQLDNYLPLLNDIRFTGPANEIMSTSFTQDSPTEPTSPECEQDGKPDTAAEILKEWDSDSESHSSNSSSGEFIWKDGEGNETAVVPTTHFDHHGGGSAGGGRGDGSASGSGDSGSGSEGDEVEFVPSSWDCRAEPAKSSLRSLEHAPPDSKKRVVFKRQKYHCVYEYPREVADLDSHSPAYLPDFSTYCEWDPSSAEDAELGYGQLYGGPDLYPLRAGIAFGSDFDEDFFISSSARPFESLGIMTTTSQFFPGMHVKPLLNDLPDEVTEHFPPPPEPLPAPSLPQTRTPSLDFTTPDSGVEDITPGSTTDDDFKTKLSESEVTQCWRPADSGSSSESVSPSSPGGEALGGLRHTRDKLKLDLPPSPLLPSPRHNRVFNFVLDKPKRHRVPDEKPVEIGTTPLVMSDETPIITTALSLPKDSEEIPVPEPTFSTFGKCLPKNAESEQKMILTDEVHEETSDEVKEESPVKTVEAVKGEGTVLDSGDEDSGIESSSKATLERNKTPNLS